MFRLNSTAAFSKAACHVCLLAVSLITLPCVAQQSSDAIAPEKGFSVQAANSIRAEKHLVSSAHPIASREAFTVLKKGGNAIDAMVVTQLVLGLVEPQSSGLGGGAFLLYHNAKSKTLHTFDGRETAPREIPDTVFLDSEGKPLGFFEAVVGGRSVGTPGIPKLLWETHQRFGRLPWAELLAPVIELAEKGFKVSPRLAAAIADDAERLSIDPSSAAYFLPEGTPLKAGAILRNPDYAASLRTLAERGGNAFYGEEFSNAIVAKVRSANKPGYLSTRDFADYKLIERKPVCSLYQAYKVCGMGPPSSGAIAVNQILGMLEPFALDKYPSASPQALQLIAEASRLAFADRGRYLADEDYVAIPTGLLDKTYLQARSKLIEINKASSEVQAGLPSGLSGRFDTGATLSQPSTTHFVIIDTEGNIVSMTSTIENGFGSRLMVKGFLLNNELTDFSFSPKQGENYIANRVQGGKRPRSSMAPTIVYKDTKPVIALGSPGGSRIINYVANTLIALIDWQVPIEQAFKLPHVVNRFGDMDVEADTPAIDYKNTFETMGYKVNIRDLNSGLHGAIMIDGKWTAAADPRREGLALGE